MDAAVRTRAPSSSGTTMGASRRASKGMLLAVLLVMVATTWGGFRSLTLAGRAAEGTATLRVGDTRVGVIGVEEVVGLAASDMGGMAHNISGLVQDDRMMLRVSVRISAGGSPTTYDVSQLRAYTTGSTKPILPVGGSLDRGYLSAHAQIEGSINFVVPRDGAHLVLRASGSTRSIDLGSIDRAAPGGGPHGDPDHDPDHDAGPGDHATTPSTIRPRRE